VRGGAVHHDHRVSGVGVLVNVHAVADGSITWSGFSRHLRAANKRDAHETAHQRQRDKEARRLPPQQQRPSRWILPPEGGWMCCGAGSDATFARFSRLQMMIYGNASTTQGPYQTPAKVRAVRSRKAAIPQSRQSGPLR
jgi:hypothetical protein